MPPPPVLYFPNKITLVYFISGHITLTKEEFQEHYVPKIDEARKNSHANVEFIMGDAAGCDYMAQCHLQSSSVPFTVFHMFEKPRHDAGATKLVNGSASKDCTSTVFKSDDERDTAMTLASQIDIAWTRPGKGGRKSGTGRNIRRRKDQERLERIAEKADWPRYYVGTGEEGRIYLIEPVDVGGEEDDEELVPMPHYLEERCHDAWHEYQMCQEEIKNYLNEHKQDNEKKKSR